MSCVRLAIIFIFTNILMVESCARIETRTNMVSIYRRISIKSLTRAAAAIGARVCVESDLKISNVI